MLTDVIANVASKMSPPFRPPMPTALEMKQMTQEEERCLDLMVACWAEEPDKRPAFHSIKSRIEKENHGRLDFSCSCDPSRC